MKKIAMLIENLYDEKEFIFPYYRLLEEGYQVDVLGSKANTTYKGKHGLPFQSDLATSEANPSDYDALVIPGGFSPDYMRRVEATKTFTNEMNKQGKIIAAICHAPWLLISSLDLSKHTLTGYHSLKTDIENAKARYVDQEVVVSENIITSRNPNDLPIYVKTIIKTLEG